LELNHEKHIVRGCRHRGGRTFARTTRTGQSDDKLGTVNFETSCKPEAQKLFNQAMLYQHSFWYRASQKVFETC